jgi:integrase
MQKRSMIFLRSAPATSLSCAADGDWAIGSVVEQSSKQIGIEHFGAHDLRRTCAKLCRKNGGDLEQIKFLLGHSSIQTTERYIGSEQDIEIAVNDDLRCDELVCRIMLARVC